MVKHHKAMFEEQTPNGKWIYTFSMKCLCHIRQDHVVRKNPKGKK